MPQGLQIFDEQGNVMLDIHSRLTRFLGTVNDPPSDDWVEGMINIPQDVIGDGGIFYYRYNDGMAVRREVSGDSEQSIRNLFGYIKKINSNTLEYRIRHISFAYGAY